MKMRLALLDRDEIYQIHLATLEILERTGTIVNSSRALQILGDAGAYIDQKTKIVKFPSHLVEEALRNAPKRIVLCGRDAKNDIRLEDGRVHFGLGSTTPNVIDPDTWERKPGRKEYIEKGARLADALPNIKFVEQLCMAMDCISKGQDVHEFAAVISNTLKPIVAIAYTPSGVRDFIRIASMVSGGIDNLRKRPLMLVYSEPVAPLQNDEKYTDILIEVAKEGLPVLYGAIAQAGATGPVTLAGTVAQSNAEVLVGLVISQLVRKGTPFVHGVISSIMDQKTSVMAYGAPEFALINVMCAQLTQYYGLPYFGTGGTTDSKVVDGQAALEAMMTALPAVLCGTNLIHDVGYLESGMTASYEMIVVGNEIAEICFRIARGVTVDDDTLATDIVANVGPGGQFLAQKHTIKHLQLGEHWMPTLSDRNRYENWSKTGSKDFTTRVRGTVQKLLREHQPEPLPSDVIAGMNEVLAEAAQRALKG